MQALATPSRLRILGRLRQGPAPVGELAPPSAWSSRRHPASSGCCVASAWSPGSGPAGPWSTPCSTATSRCRWTKPPTMPSIGASVSLASPDWLLAGVTRTVMQAKPHHEAAEHLGCAA
jgi:hypothetical protein